MNGTVRNNIKKGAKVMVVQKHDQGTRKLTEGIVMKILTNSSRHPRGIKVMLEEELWEEYRVSYSVGLTERKEQN